MPTKKIAIENAISKDDKSIENIKCIKNIVHHRTFHLSSTTSAMGAGTVWISWNECVFGEHSGFLAPCLITLFRFVSIDMQKNYAILFTLP